jgi:hypothetical protein
MIGGGAGAGAGAASAMPSIVITAIVEITSSASS